MAYFSNSGEGAALDEICQKCVHLGPTDGPGCQVLCMQLLWNYEQASGNDTDTAEEKTKTAALDMLIENGSGEVKCHMFFPIEWLSDRGKFEIGKADQEAKDRLKLAEWNKLYA